jgi:NAD-dependent dihydropyrimidine dehydrogenase PreA subunit
MNVGIGAPLYLEAQVPTGTVVTGVQWSLTSQPAGSTAQLTASPLGASVPIYNPGDREVNEVAGRIVLVPDIVGSYTVSATVSTDGAAIQLTRLITGATYIGAGKLDLEFHDPPQCARCHSETFTEWQGTRHATAMTRKIDGIGVTHFAEYCLKCHNLGYDTTPAADNGGFDDVARLNNWIFPPEAEPGNWAAMPEDLKAVSNVQCESCHGPGSQHSRTGGNPIHITSSTSSGDCGQCHEAPPYHTKNAQWNLSRHAVATRYPTGENRSACVGCHSGIGFIDRVDGLPENQLRTDYEAIVCATCHDPHDATNPHQLRKVDGVTLKNGYEVTEGGNGRICMNCHISRQDGEVYAATANGSSRFGPHHGPQTDMLVGQNAVEYGRYIPSSAHATAVKNTCATCHMHELASSDPAKNLAGEHTFKPVWDNGTPADHADDVDLVGACASCHGNINSFDFARYDYDANGTIEGVQTEVKSLLDQLGKFLPPYGDPAVSITSAYTRPELKAAFNYQFVLEDGSMGVHNTSYAVNLIKASIADITGDGTILGDSDNDCLPDSWEVQYFGSITAQTANDDWDQDGLSNAFELSAMTNPTLADSDGDTFSDFVELHSGTNPNNGADNPEVGRSSIYTAAEMLYVTEPNKTYQLQRVSDLGTTTWENVGDPVVGDGGMLQHFISTRETERGFYRVIEVQP